MTIMAQNSYYYKRALFSEEEETNGGAGKPPEEELLGAEKWIEGWVEVVELGDREDVVCEREEEAGAQEREYQETNGADVEEVGDNHSTHDDVEKKRKAGVEAESSGQRRNCGRRRQYARVGEGGVEGVGSIESQEECDELTPPDISGKDEEEQSWDDQHQEAAYRRPHGNGATRRDRRYRPQTPHSRHGYSMPHPRRNEQRRVGDNTSTVGYP